MIKLNEKWIAYLKGQPGTGMSYQIARVVLGDGRVFERVVIVGNTLCEVDGSKNIPFTVEDEIVAIEVRSGLRQRA